MVVLFKELGIELEHILFWEKTYFEEFGYFFKCKELGSQKKVVSTILFIVAHRCPEH
jgi:hypothetical protein